jgi:hypothetical protein
MEPEVYNQAPKKKRSSTKLVKRRRGHANYAPVTDALMAELRKGPGTAAELFYRIAKSLPSLVQGTLRNALDRLRKPPWRRLRICGWQRHEKRTGGKTYWAAVYGRGRAADEPKPAPIGHAEAQRRYRQKKRQRLAGASIFALAASLQTSQNRHSAKGSDDVQALP